MSSLPGFGHIASGASVHQPCWKTSLGHRVADVPMVFRAVGPDERIHHHQPSLQSVNGHTWTDVQALQAKVPAKFSPIGVESPVPVRPVDPAAVTSLRLLSMFLFEEWDQMLATMLRHP